MRNQPKPLTDVERYTQSTALNALTPLQGTERMVELRYTKRPDRSGRVVESSSTGKVLFFNGIPGMDTGSVTIEDPSKGNRTINLHRITSYRVVK